MELEVSQKTEKIAYARKLSVEQLAFADLCAADWEPADAFIVAFHKGSTWIKSALKNEVNTLLKSKPVQERIAEMRHILTEKQKEAAKQTDKKERNSIVDTAMSKEQMLYDLQTAKTKMKTGSKEWLDTNKLIVDVTRMKQEEVVNEETTIHHFLPVHYPTGCQDCLYQRCNSCKYKRAYYENAAE